MSALIEPSLSSRSIALPDMCADLLAALGVLEFTDAGLKPELTTTF